MKKQTAAAWVEAVKRNVNDVTDEEVKTFTRAARAVDEARVSARQARRAGDDVEDDRQSERARKVFSAMQGWDSRKGVSQAAREEMVSVVNTMMTVTSF